MLKTIQSAKNLLSSIIEDVEVSSVCGSGDYKDKMLKRLPFTFKNLNGATGYLTPKARLAFTNLRKVFTKALIFQYFDPECHIRIKTNTSGTLLVEV